MADNAEKTIADELREAATRLRKIGSKVMPGPWESLNDGDRLVAWRNVPGTDFDDDMEYVFDEPLEKETAEWVALVNPDLAEPLAAWLEEAADTVDELGVHPVLGPGERTRAALAVARVLNGGVS